MLCVSARFVALLGLRRPEQREQLQWPVRPHLCGGGAIKAPDGGESEERGAGCRRTARRQYDSCCIGTRRRGSCLEPSWHRASDRCLLRSVICRAQASWKHICVIALWYSAFAFSYFALV